MNKKLIISLIVIIVLAGLVIANRAGLLGSKEKPIGLLAPKEKPGLREGVGYGHSTNPDEGQAAQEAVSMMQENLNKSPDFVFVFSSIVYDESILINEIKNLLPASKIYGGTSSLGPMTTKGYLGSEKQSVGIMGIARPEIIWGVGGADLDETPALQAGKEAISGALENAGQEQGQKPAIVFMTAAPGKEEKIIQGIEQVIGDEVPIFGGSSGDNEIIGKWKQFANTQVYKNGVALAVAFTDLKVAYAYEAGYPVTEETGTVTRAEGRIIYEINERPAAQVYNEWTGGVFSEQIEKGGKVWGILTEATLYPIAKVLQIPGKEPFHLAVHPLSIHPDLSLEVFADVKDGDEIALLHGNWEILLNRFKTTPEKAMKRFRIKKGGGIFALYTFCGGTLLAIPENERSKMPLLLKNTIGNTPFIGNFTFGEQGFIPDIGNQHGNLVNSIVIFTKQ